MSKRFKKYCILWSVFFVIFNIVAFVSPSKSSSYDKFVALIWIEYAQIMGSLILQPAMVYLILKDMHCAKSLWGALCSYVSLGLTFLAGTCYFAFRFVPNWAAGSIHILALLILLIEFFGSGVFTRAITQRVNEKGAVEREVLELESDSDVVECPLLNEIRERTKEKMEELSNNEGIDPDVCKLKQLLESINDLLLVKACFLKIDLECGFTILSVLGYEKEEVLELYPRLMKESWESIKGKYTIYIPCPPDEAATEAAGADCCQ